VRTRTLHLLVGGSASLRGLRTTRQDQRGGQANGNEACHHDWHDKEVLPRQGRVDDERDEEGNYDGTNPHSIRLGERCHLPKHHGLHEQVDTDDEAEAEIEVPIRSLESFSFEAVALHGFEY